MFHKILIANRGEIAVRLVRACRDLGIGSVAVFSDADRAALHVLLADEAYRLGPAPAAESYLSIGRVLDAARRSGADAIHPGYGFLSENPEFPAACADAGVVFIGPTPASMAALGSKTAARALARREGVPILEGTVEAVASLDAAQRVAAEVGYPVMLKAAAGGGGKGMRLVASAAELPSAWALAGAEAASAFGDAAIFIERALVQPRHVEIQILGDSVGHLIWLGERDCSMQRRHQKIIEESPAPRLRAETRAAMGAAALQLARAAAYTSAGTVEFLVDAEENFYFLEVNTRLQVEHPVTEAVTGIDLVEQQIRIAAGEPLRIEQAAVAPRGHALECRIYAEDPEQNFMPSPGRITRLLTPQGPGVRVDSGIYEGWNVPLDYDPLLAKLIVWGANREQAVARMQRALGEYQIAGVRHNLGFFRRVFADPAFQAGEIDTSYVARLLAQPAPAAAPVEAAWKRHEQSGRPLPPVEARPQATSGSDPAKSGEPQWEQWASVAAAIAAKSASGAKSAPPSPAPSAWQAAARHEGRQ
ncbi:MAG TPA: acetyl-CoA carboxylase biotin carboxylase subunit [Terriglobales bacterium]|jgi:acetyl-CoA carboxylase biotin carboxylase subunit